MAESHVVSGLVAKRSEVDGLIQHHKSEIQRLAADLSHLDATIKLFAPDYDLRTVRAKAHREKNSYFRPGECPRWVMEILRQNGFPMTCRQIVEGFKVTKGFVFDENNMPGVLKIMNSVMSRMEKSGTVRTVGRESESRALLWELAA